MPVVVANRDLPAGTVIDFELMAKMEMPERYVTSSVVKAAEFEKKIGLKLAFEMKRGDLFLTNNMLSDEAAKEQERFGEKIHKTARAMTLPVDGADCVLPGDHVGILATLRNPETKELENVVLYRYLSVLAKDSQASEAGKPASGSSKLTFLVMPKEAQVLAMAARTGDLHVTLRNPDDVSEDERMLRVNRKNLLELVRELKEKRASRQNRKK